MAWSIEKNFQNQNEIFSSMLEAIHSAERAIDFESFIFERDELGTRILDAFIAASRRGVRVRLLVDGVGSTQFDAATVDQLDRNGVRVRLHRPWRAFLRSVFRLLTHLRWRGISREFAEMNRRNHRKTCVIDGKKAWVGSANVSVRHASWRETAVYLEGEDVSLIVRSFDWLWARSRRGWRSFSSRRPPPSNEYVHLSYGFFVKRESTRYQRVLIDSARKRIRVINPYFLPPWPMLLSLLRARRAGVRVEVMVPFETDYWIVNWVARSYYSVLVGAGIKLYEYRPAMLHSKILIVDQVALVGSSNFNFRSFIHDIEMDVLLDKPESISALDAQWEKDMLGCTRVETPKIRSLGLVGRLLDDVYQRFLAYFKRVM